MMVLDLENVFILIDSGLDVFGVKFLNPLFTFRDLFYVIGIGT